MSQSSTITTLDSVALGGTCQFANNSFKNKKGGTLYIPNDNSTLNICALKHLTDPSDTKPYFITKYTLNLCHAGDYFAAGSVDARLKDCSIEAGKRYAILGDIPKPQHITPYISPAVLVITDKTNNTTTEDFGGVLIVEESDMYFKSKQAINFVLDDNKEYHVYGNFYYRCMSPGVSWW